MRRRIQKYPKLISLSLIIGMAASGCASFSHSSKNPPNEEITSEKFKAVEKKVIELEERLGALNEKIDLLNEVRPEPSAKTESKPETDLKLPEKVQAPAASKNSAIPKPFKPSSKFAESFHQDEATDRYREAKILFDTKKYSDSILEFSEFIKDHPRHILASNAQYFIGISYLKQNEYTLAEEELNRVLMSYPHSNAIPDTLLALIEVSSHLKKSSRVAYYREKLNSHFPNSPQAKQIPTENTEPENTITAESNLPKIDEEKISIEKPSTPQMNINDSSMEPSVVKQ
jgi:TolA-binding protein